MGHKLKTQLYAALELASLPGIGAARFKALIAQYGNPVAALAELAPPLENPRNKRRWTPAEIDRALQYPEGGITYYGAGDYPSLLGECPEPPPYLFWKGTLWPVTQPTVTLVGARDASEPGRLFAHTLAGNLAAHGVTTVSGGARGIDAAAHSGALAAGGLSLLIAATGIDVVYPPENQALFHNIQKNGSIITELLPGTPPRRDFFPTRNRILVGISQALIVIEGGSGSWSSARHALRLGRPIFAWNRSPYPALRQLPDLLLAKGALALSDPEPELVLRAIGVMRKTNAESAPALGNCVIGEPGVIRVA